MDLVELFEDAALSDNPNIKVCLSSRPLLEFEHAFIACPSLRLQDLTHQDIKTYIDEQLVQDSKMSN